MFRTGNFGRLCFTDLVSGGASVLTSWSMTVCLFVNGMVELVGQGKVSPVGRIMRLCVYAITLLSKLMDFVIRF